MCFISLCFYEVSKFVRQSYIYNICGALHNMVPFVQFKNRGKHPWRSVTFSKVAGFSEATEWVNLPAVERRLKIVPKPGVYLFAEEVD